MTFSKNGFEVVRNVIDQQSLDLLKTQFKMLRDVLFYTENKKDPFAFNDTQTTQCFSVYGAYLFESLAVILQDKVSSVVNLDLDPTYTYARIYYNGSTLKPHIDRESCEYSTTVCIDATDDWPFCIKSRSGETYEITLKPGDMCVYSGCDLEHWREEFEGDSVMQCFLHYVDSNGPNKEFKYDKRPMLGYTDGNVIQKSQKPKLNSRNVVYK